MKQCIKNVLIYGYLFSLPLVSFAFGGHQTNPTQGSDLNGTAPGGLNSTAPSGLNSGVPGGLNSTAPSVLNGSSPGSSGQLINPLKATSICTLFKDVLHITIQLAIPVILLFLVYSGFQFVMARGNSIRLQNARENLFWTIVGIGLFLGAWTLASVLVGTINTLQPNSVSSC